MMLHFSPFRPYQAVVKGSQRAVPLQHHRRICDVAASDICCDSYEQVGDAVRPASVKRR